MVCSSGYHAGKLAVCLFAALFLLLLDVCVAQLCLFSFLHLHSISGVHFSLRIFL